MYTQIEWSLSRKKIHNANVYNVWFSKFEKLKVNFGRIICIYGEKGNIKTLKLRTFIWIVLKLWNKSLNKFWDLRINFNQRWNFLFIINVRYK